MGLFSNRGTQPAGEQCPCGQGPLEIHHLDSHIVEVMTTSGVPALTYDCPLCGMGSELWRRDEEGRGGAPAGLYVHMMQVHHRGLS